MGVFVLRPDHSDGPPAAAVVNPYEQQRRAGVQRLLDSWAKATRTGDTAALKALFDPKASPDFVDEQIRRAQNLSGVPLSDWGFDISDEPDVVVSPDAPAQLGASDVWAPPVYLRYAISGSDAAPTRKPVALTVARHGDDWKLVSDDPLGDRRTWRGPWDFGPMIVRSVPVGDGRTAVVLGHPDQESEVDALADEVRTAVPAVTDLWGTDWARTVTVVATSSRDEFTELAGSSHSGGEIAAVAVSDAVPKGARTVTGQRVVFSPEAADRLTAETRRSVLRHELTHVAARKSTVDGSPMWMLEGFADYSGYRGSNAPFATIAPEVTRQTRQNGPPDAVPADSDFADPDRAGIAYELGWSLCQYIATTYGEPKLVELYHRLSQGPVDSAGVDAALRDVVETGLTDFLARWGGWVSVQAR